jgi:hypothetical protein
MTAKYFLVIAEVVSFACTPIRSTIVISEPIEDFIVRNSENDPESQTFSLLQFTPSTKAAYDKLKPYNPTNESYFKLNNSDYSVIIQDEDEDEDEDDSQRIILTVKDINEMNYDELLELIENEGIDIEPEDGYTPETVDKLREAVMAALDL